MKTWRSLLFAVSVLLPFWASADVTKVLNDGDKTYTISPADFTYAGSNMYLVDVEDGGKFFGKGLLFVDFKKKKFKLTVFENRDFTAYTIEGDWQGTGPGSTGYLIYNTGKTFKITIGSGGSRDTITTHSEELIVRTEKNPGETTRIPEPESESQNQVQSGKITGMEVYRTNEHGDKDPQGGYYAAAVQVQGFSGTLYIEIDWGDGQISNETWDLTTMMPSTRNPRFIHKHRYNITEQITVTVTVTASSSKTSNGEDKRSKNVIISPPPRDAKRH